VKQMSRESCGAKRNLIIYLAQLHCQASRGGGGKEFLKGGEILGGQCVGKR